MTSLVGDLRQLQDYYLASKRAAPDQGGVLNGIDPTAVNNSNPLRLWIIQLIVIISMIQILGFFLRKIRQPRVIAEVITGIILGPTAMGRIPHFTEHIFPPASLPFLSLVANIGLVLFLFLVGLEIDTTSIKRNARLSVIIGIGGILLPFAVGTGMSKPIWDNFIPHTGDYTHFLVFIGVSYSITAFPVLCRILTELKLLDTTVGLCVLCAGVGNDIIGWTLLALSVALVNATSKLTALWIILIAVGYVLFLFFPVRIALRWFARRTNSDENGPSVILVTVILIMVFISAFFTDIIGIHPIFGGFLIGFIVPREGGLAIALTEKLEDLVTLLFVPIYFVLSGLSTNLGLLNTGKVWGYLFAIIATDWGGKFTGSFTAARIAGFSPREAATVGSFMSCKGLVELVVLNIGLQAGILTQQVFSMFVVDALVLTFLTTPAVVALYPPRLRTRASTPYEKASLEGATSKGATNTIGTNAESQIGYKAKTRAKFLIVLDKFEHLPGLMGLTQVLWPSKQTSVLDGIVANTDTISQAISIHALRLIELTDRTSAVMKSSYTEELAMTDSMLQVFRTHSELNGARVRADLNIVSWDSFGHSVEAQATDSLSEMVIVGWAPPVALSSPEDGHGESSRSGPFDALFKSTSSVEKSAAYQSHLLRNIFAQSPVDTAVLLDRRPANEASSPRIGRRRVMLPFFGGPDDRCALELLVQLVAAGQVEGVVMRIKQVGNDTQSTSPTVAEEKGVAHQAASLFPGFTLSTVAGRADTQYGHADTATMLQSRVADDLVWEHFTRTKSESLEPFWRNIQFEIKDTPQPLEAMVRRAEGESQLARGTSSRLLILIGRSRRLAADSFHQELKKMLEQRGASGSGGEMRKTFGDPSTALVVSHVNADLLVIQAAKGGAV